MSKWKVTARVSIEETAKIDFIVEAETGEEALEKVGRWEGEEIDEYDNTYIDRSLFMEDEWEAKKQGD